MSVSVPAGALPAGTTISVYPVTAMLADQIPSGQSYLVSFAISWEAPDGTTPAATSPLVMTITDASVLAGDIIYEVTSSGLRAIGTATANGSATVTFTSDPIFVVASVPRVSLGSAKVVLTGTTIPVALTCQVATCKGELQLAGSIVKTIQRGKRSITETKVVTLAGASYRLANGKRITVRLRLSAAGRSLLQHVGNRPLHGTLSATVSGGITGTKAVIVS